MSSFTECMIKKRQELQEELQRIEQRCLRARGPWAKENDPDVHSDKDTETHPKDPENAQPDQEIKQEGDGASKRNKFAMDADEKEKDDSDGDDRHDDEPVSDKITPKEEKGRVQSLRILFSEICHRKMLLSRIFTILQAPRSRVN